MQILKAVLYYSLLMVYNVYACVENYISLLFVKLIYIMFDKMC